MHVHCQHTPACTVPACTALWLCMPAVRALPMMFHPC